MHSYFAAQANQNLLSALGINWKLLVTQALAFAILVWILGKFVYPPLIRSIDERRRTIEAGLQEAKESREALDQAEVKVETLLAEARQEAEEIVIRSREDSAALVADAEKRASERAERIVQEARTRLEADVQVARQALKSDVVQLVAVATKRIIDEKLDPHRDAEIIRSALSRQNRKERQL
jgi:F-type H+-transporting ATPase subunit b